MISTPSRHTVPDLERSGDPVEGMPAEADCPRCLGLMTKAFFADLEDDTGEYGFWALRCMQCGEVIDPIILRNRVAAMRRVYKGRARL